MHRPRAQDGPGQGWVLVSGLRLPRTPRSLRRGRRRRTSARSSRASRTSLSRARAAHSGGTIPGAGPPKR
eukprot:9496769-Pyramimonas_sp.AAC.1